MQPVESLDDRNRHPSRRPRAVQDDLVRLGLAVPDLRRHDPSGNRQTPVGPSNLLPFSFPLSFVIPKAAHLSRTTSCWDRLSFADAHLPIKKKTRLIAVSPPCRK